MPRKSLSGLEHVKTVRRKGVDYLYMNMGQKVKGKAVYKSIGRKDSPDIGQRYATALAARNRRQNVPQALTVPDLIRLYERSAKHKDLSQGTQRTYGVYLRQLETLFPTAPAAEVEPRDMYAMIDHMADRPAAAKMILLTARQVFKWGKKRHHVPNDPTDGIEAEHIGEEYEPWPEHLIDVALADPKLRAPVALLYFTGQRIGDVLNMRWSDIRDGIIFVTQQKTGKELEIPVHSELGAILAEAPRKGLCILANDKGRKPSDQTVRLWIKDFGLEHGVKLLPHGLRKNAVNALLEAGCSTGETSSITGQSLRIVEWYAKRRNNPRMAKAAILKWERKGNGETLGKTDRESRGNA